MSQRRTAILAASGTSALFLIVYSVTNAMAATRGDLGSFHFGWETSIPLVPAMILPYMSIDLLFFGAPFVCSTRREIGVFTRRVVAATLIAGALFIAWPLTSGFERAPVDGPFGPIFNALRTFDQPHNLFPSLHVTLAFILRWTYHRHTRGVTRGLMHIWFVLVTASTVLTHQHHLIDVAGGAALALFVMYLFPTGLISREDVRATSARSPRLAFAYGAGAALATAIGVLAAQIHWGWAVLPFWAAVSLGIVALGYGALGPRVFRKYAGYVSIPARAVLAPYLLGLWLTRHWFWARGVGQPKELCSGVHFGGLPKGAIARNVSIIDLTAEHNSQRVGGQRAGNYANFPVLDLTTPDNSTLNAIADRIDHDRARGDVYVHCALGLGRSVHAVAWWLHRSGRARSLDHAVAIVRTT
jgi:membrane-associated phospholipid phosphatase